MEEDRNPSPKLFQVFAKLLDGTTATLRFTTPHAYGHAVKQRIFEITKIPTYSQRLICGGAQVGDHSVISIPECTVHVVLRLLGGKGGFGSLLRGAATKAGQKKTNNFDACRDMSGRRLRHVNAEKRLEEWKAEEEERRLEKIAEEFLKKKVKTGKKGVGDGEAEKYVEKYRQDSAKCSAEVEAAVREAFGNGNGNGNGKRKKKALMEGLDTKRHKIWMGKRKLGGSDGEDSSDEDSSDEDEDNEKSVVLNNGNHSDSSKETGGSLDSVTGEKQSKECSGASSPTSGSEEAREADVELNSKSGPCEIVSIENVESDIHAETVVLEASKSPEIEAVKAEKQENTGTDSQTQQLSSSENGEVAENRSNPNGGSHSTSELNEETPVPVVENTDPEKPLDFDEFPSAADLEVLGMERLKVELQTRGLKCGGTLQERAARLVLLKSTPLEKLPKKLLAKK